MFFKIFKNFIKKQDGFGYIVSLNFNKKGTMY